MTVRVTVMNDIHVKKQKNGKRKLGFEPPFQRLEAVRAVHYANSPDLEFGPKIIKVEVGRSWWLSDLKSLRSRVLDHSHRPLIRWEVPSTAVDRVVVCLFVRVI